MLIAQITDLHIGFDDGEADGLNERRLAQVLQHLNDGPNRPDLLLVTGDLAEAGGEESYRMCADMFARCGFPVHVCPGNHDDRETLSCAFPAFALVDGFMQSCIDLPGLRVILLDTLEPGRQGGAFCGARAAWLAARLAEAPAVPTIIALHHPPLPLGIAWMDPGAHEPWAERLRGALAGHDQVRAILCGHVHHAFTTRFAGVPLAVCPSVAPQLVVDLRAIDPEQPDGRAMIVADPPGYALHRWNGDGLVTAFMAVTDAPVVARYDTALQRVVRQVAAERTSAGG